MVNRRPLKRTFHVTRDSLPMNKRLKTIERQVYRNRPEMKTTTVNVTASIATNQISIAQPCRMAQGTNGSERIGDRIRVWRIECRGLTNGRLDHFILQQKTTTAPSLATFTANPGAFINDLDNTNKFTEWSHYRNLSASDVSKVCPLKQTVKFRGGMVVKYNGAGTTDIVDNEISVVVLNRSAVTNDVSYTIRMWYTDA